MLTPFLPLIARARPSLLYSFHDIRIPGRAVNINRSTRIRLAELMAALSLATDLGMGQPLEFALRACVLAVRLGDALHYSEAALREIYYQTLLRYIGCNVDTHLLASIVGDEMALRADFATIDNGSLIDTAALFARFIRQANAGASQLHTAQALARGLIALPQVKASFAGHCEVAQRLAQRLGFDHNIVYGLGQLYERWDGTGAPRGLKGEAIAPAVLVVTLAQDAILFHRLGGLDAAVNTARERRGAAYSPAVVDCFCQHAAPLMSGLDDEPSWDSVLALEPGPHDCLTETQFDEACRALADFVDIKSLYTYGHSPRVADLAGESARRGGLPQSSIIDLKRAALLHDLGKTGISISIWDKTGPLTDREREQIRLHPYYTQRILARPNDLARLGELAAAHHERLDGSGYHRGLKGSLLTPSARILIAANFYQVKCEQRPHRAALSPEQAADELRREVKAGRLDDEAVNAVLAAAGQRSTSARRDLMAGLSEREMEVLRLLARGQSIKAIAAQLNISPKTVDSHVQHIYNKIGVSTRAGATLFALEHDLIA